MKKRIIISSLACAFALFSCSNNPKDDGKYCITINQVDHLHLDQTSFTFNRDDFSPITFNYRTDDNYGLSSLTADSSIDNLCDYTIDGTNLTVTITPKVNADFIITPIVRHFDALSHIRIIGDAYVTPKVSELMLAKDDFEPRYIEYTLADNYLIKNITVAPSDVATCVDASGGLQITLKKNGDCTITLETVVAFVDINFSPVDGELGQKAQSTIKCLIGRRWGECFKSDEQVATYKQYDFKGWSMRNGGHGDVIGPSYIVTENTPKNVYASYSHHIEMITESLEVSSINYNPDSPRLMLDLKEGVTKYDYPLDETAFTVTNSSGNPVDFEYGDDLGKKYIRINDPTQVDDGYIKIEVIDYQPTYEIEFNLGAHLKTTSTLSPKKGENFEFDIQAVNPTNENIYYIPRQLKIYVGTSGQPLSSVGYSITNVDEARQNGRVVIYADYVQGDIEVNGEAGQTDYYYYEFKGFGTGIEEKESDVVLSNKITKLHLYATWISVDAENIAVKFNNQEWKTVDEIKDGTITYNQGVITINNTAKTFDSVIIYALSQNWNLFGESPWEDIQELAYSGYVERLFDVGDTKKVSIGELNYEVRIIGFAHDDLADKSGKASLTIEFSNLITDADLSVHKGRICKDATDYYPGSDYDKYINGTFYDSLPANLKSIIKLVTKKYNVADSSRDLNPYDRKMFALTLKEIGGSEELYDIDEGKTYKYYEDTYNDSSKESRKKGAVGSHDSSGYWLSSAYINGSEQKQYYIRSDGSIGYGEKSSKSGYMVAFCI
ncbi:MAG: DUF6273 domain-containing protein [Bacilli bacterium]|nr:DUF6273 domain-containing protein [Bacilli bacterium]